MTSEHGNQISKNKHSFSGGKYGGADSIPGGGY